MQFINHFKDGLDVILLKKGDTRNKIITDRRLVLGPQKCICYLLTDLESKCLKQQYILARGILDFAKTFKCEGPHITLAAQNVTCVSSLKILPNEMKSHSQLCEQVEMFMQVRSV